MSEFGVGGACTNCSMEKKCSYTSSVKLNSVPDMVTAVASAMFCSLIRFPDSAVHSLDTQQDAALIVRKLTEGKTKPVHFREVRPHLLAEALSFEAESAQVSRHGNVL